MASPYRGSQIFQHHPLLRASHASRFSWHNLHSTLCISQTLFMHSSPQISRHMHLLHARSFFSVEWHPAHSLVACSSDIQTPAPSTKQYSSTGETS